MAPPTAGPGGAPGSIGAADRSGPAAGRGVGPLTGVVAGAGGPRTGAARPCPGVDGAVEPPVDGAPGVEFGVEFVPGRGGRLGAGAPPGRGSTTKALEATRSADAGSAVGASLGWFHTVPPTTKVLPPPPSRFAASVAPRPTNRSAACLMVRPADEACRPSTTTKKTSPALFHPTRVRGWRAATTLGSFGHGSAGCPSWRTTGVVPMLSTAFTGVCTMTSACAAAVPCWTLAQTLLSWSAAAAGTAMTAPPAGMPPGLTRTPCSVTGTGRLSGPRGSEAAITSSIPPDGGVVVPQAGV